jgi:hypothetical protein
MAVQEVHTLFSLFSEAQPRASYELQNVFLTEQRLPDKKKGFILLATLQQHLRVIRLMRPETINEPWFESIEQLTHFVWGRSHFLDDDWQKYVSIVADFQRVFPRLLHAFADRSWLSNPVWVELVSFFQVRGVQSPPHPAHTAMCGGWMGKTSLALVRDHHFHDRRVMEGGHQKWMKHLSNRCHKTVTVDDKCATFEFVNAAERTAAWFEGVLPTEDSPETKESEHFRRRLVASPNASKYARTAPCLVPSSLELTYNALTGKNVNRGHFRRYTQPDCLCFQCLPQRDPHQTDLVMYLEALQMAYPRSVSEWVSGQMGLKELPCVLVSTQLPDGYEAEKHSWCDPAQSFLSHHLRGQAPRGDYLGREFGREFEQQSADEDAIAADCYRWQDTLRHRPRKVYRFQIRSFRLLRCRADDAWVKIGDTVSVQIPGIHERFIMKVERAGVWRGWDRRIQSIESPGRPGERPFVAGQIYPWSTMEDQALSSRWWGNGERGLRFACCRASPRKMCIPLQWVSHKVELLVSILLFLGYFSNLLAISSRKKLSNLALDENWCCRLIFRWKRF